MSKDPTPRIILLHETALQSWARDASSVASIVVLVGLGVLLDSSAMQWVGAALFFVGFMSRCSKMAKSCERLTPQQAADHLANEFGVVASPRREGGAQ